MRENKELAAFWKELAAKANEMNMLMRSKRPDFTLNRDKMATDFLRHMQENYRNLGDLTTIRENLIQGQGFLMKAWCDGLYGEQHKDFSSDILAENAKYFFDQLEARNAERKIFKPDLENSQESRPVTAEVTYALMKKAEWESSKLIIREMVDLMTTNRLRNEVGMKLMEMIDARHDSKSAIAERALEVVKIIKEINSKPQKGLQHEVDEVNKAMEERMEAENRSEAVQPKLSKEPESKESKGKNILEKARGLKEKVGEKIKQKKEERKQDKEPWNNPDFKIKF